MNKPTVLAVFASMVLAMSSSFAGSDNKDVSVTIALTSACTMTTPSAISVTYTSFSAAVASSAADGGAFNVKCTNTLPYNIGFDTAATPAATKSVTASASNNQLAYQLSLVSSSGTGNGSNQANRVVATVTGNQSGDCSTSTCAGTAETHTVYVAY